MPHRGTAGEQGQNPAEQFRMGAAAWADSRVQVVVENTVQDQIVDEELAAGSIRGDQVVPVLAVAQKARQGMAQEPGVVVVHGMPVEEPAGAMWSVGAWTCTG